MAGIHGFDSPFWHDSTVLAGIERPRHATAPVAMLPYYHGGWHDADIIFANVRSFREDLIQRKILWFIGKRCGYREGDSDWPRLRRFLRNMMGGLLRKRR